MAPAAPPPGDPPPLPLPPRRLAVVEFPGYVRHADAAVAALGGSEVCVCCQERGAEGRRRGGKRGGDGDGHARPDTMRPPNPSPLPLQALAAAASDGGPRYLAARLRAGDPLAHPLISARKPARGVVVRVATREGASSPPTITIVGVVTHAFAFPGMADAQYGGADAAGPAPPPPDAPPAALPDEPLLSVPPAFFRADLPPADGGALPRWPGGGGGGSGGGDGRRATGVSAAALPSIPFHAAHVPPPDASTAASTAVLTAMGDTPVWAPAALAARVGAAATLAAGGPRACYTFSRGPWAGLVIRRGYDPRCDPAAAAWQALRLGSAASSGSGDVDFSAVVSLSTPPPPGGLLATAADLAPALPVVATALAGARAAAADGEAGWVPRGAWRAAVDAAARVGGGDTKD